MTVDVDFGFLKHFLEQDDKAITLGPVSQGTFLEAMEGSARLKVSLNCTNTLETKYYNKYTRIVESAKCSKGREVSENAVGRLRRAYQSIQNGRALQAVIRLSVNVERVSEDIKQSSGIRL